MLELIDEQLNPTGQCWAVLTPSRRFVLEPSRCAECIRHAAPFDLDEGDAKVLAHSRGDGHAIGLCRCSGFLAVLVMVVLQVRMLVITRAG